MHTNRNTWKSEVGKVGGAGSRARAPWFGRGIVLMGLALLLSACGGGGSSSSNPTNVGYPASAASLTDPNVAPIVVKSGPGNNVNIPYVSVTVCLPGTSTCKTIDHVLLDTGSTGLRLFSSVLATTPALSLLPQTIGAIGTVYECAQFLNTVAWGTVRMADVTIANHTAANTPVQVMDNNYPTALDSVCKGGTGSTMPILVPPTATTPVSGTHALSANGILGVGLWVNDSQNYFSCTNNVPDCQITPSTGQQVQNPVARFTQDNNGVVVQLSAVHDAGDKSVQGYLILGIGTQANNGLAGTNIVPVNGNGYFTTGYGTTSLPVSFLTPGRTGFSSMTRG